MDHWVNVLINSHRSHELVSFCLNFLLVSLGEQTFIMLHNIKNLCENSHADQINFSV